MGIPQTRTGDHVVAHSQCGHQFQTMGIPQTRTGDPTWSPIPNVGTNYKQWASPKPVRATTWSPIPNVGTNFRQWASTQTRTGDPTWSPIPNVGTNFRKWAIIRQWATTWGRPYGFRDCG
ncbi:hypothetical protein [Arsenicibacter rosenii]|uniref:hypothetical protein n=1 Tax=Arsenicibacter rosenii TaxID=1750698 RepID=UPI0015A7178B|nr:hypothetical protein [Arsenicibacter rosenii]